MVDVFSVTLKQAILCHVNSTLLFGKEETKANDRPRPRSAQPAATQGAARALWPAGPGPRCRALHLWSLGSRCRDPDFQKQSREVRLAE